MTNATVYPGADTRTQDFTERFPGAPIRPNVLVIHTTECTDWPGYLDGANAPHLTAKPVIGERRLAIRQHFPLTRSSRALRNEPGGVETNVLNCMQLELIGTCDPALRATWGSRRAGRDYLYWPSAPDWALREVAAIIAWMHEEWDLELQAPSLWPPYPESYGKHAAQRLTPAQWRQFYGVLGHMHVCENDHGDPGDLDITTILTYAEEIAETGRHGTPLADQVLLLSKRALQTNRSSERRQRWQQIKELAEGLSAQTR